jgi:hypothetical protein
MNSDALRSRSHYRSRAPIAAPSGSARAGAAALCLLAASAMACSNKTTPTPDKEPLAPVSSAATASSSAGAVAEAAEAPPIPTLALESFAPEGAHPGKVYAVEGALMVVEEFRVGRIAGETIEWIGKVPPVYPAFGPNEIDSVHGRWPDSIGVIYSNTNGRAPQPAYLPLTGVGIKHTVAEGGGFGNILGVARLGESTIMASYSMYGFEFKTVRGTVQRKAQTPEEAGCKEGEVRKPEFGNPAPAIIPGVVESSPEGTLVSIGNLCEQRGPAAEVWDKTGKSRIVDVSHVWKKVSYWPKLLKGNGDELWGVSDSWTPILHYRNGEFKAVPGLEWPHQNVFVSTRGKLHANDGHTIHRFEGDKWIPVARLAKPATFGSVAMDDKDTMWVSHGGVHRLRPTPGEVAPRTCSTPFVYLYEVSSKNDKKFTYPSTRKALSTFAEVAEIGLVEFEDDYRTRLGITVVSKAQGEALIAHLRETMKEEAPRLVCFEPPKGARTIDMNAKK